MVEFMRGRLLGGESKAAARSCRTGSAHSTTQARFDSVFTLGSFGLYARGPPGTAALPLGCSLELEGELEGGHLFALLEGAFLVGVGVLEFGLDVAGEPVAEGGVHAPDVVVPAFPAAGAV